METPLLRCSVTLWTLVVFSALLKSARTQCVECEPDDTETLTTTTTTVTFGSQPNCTFSTGSDISADGVITGLTPGAVYPINVTCFNCCKEVTMKPEQVDNLSVTEYRTSSLYVTWTEPEGSSSSYRVQWTDGSATGEDTVTETRINIMNLTAGVEYEISVTAVASDGQTEGASTNVSQYTQPEAVVNLAVWDFTTSSISLTWAEPEGSRSFYRVQWTDGTTHREDSVTETNLSVTGLTPGVGYSFNVTAVAGDNTESGRAKTFHHTKPEVVKNLTVTHFTTSSVSVTWAEPEGSSSFYRVNWTDGTTHREGTVTQAHKNITNLTAGVKYEISVTAVAHDDQTEGQTTTVSQYTRPEAVTNLTVTQVTTSSVSLTWTEPEGSSSFYRVRWTGGNLNQTHRVNNTHITISQLTAGGQYRFSVTAVAGDEDTKGEPTTVSQYTRPDMVRNLIITDVTTSSVSLQWTAPEGHADWYELHWSAGEKVFSNTTDETSVTITDLIPGHQYNISVAAVAGKLSNEGNESLITTFTRPGKPGNITANSGTNDLTISWTPPAGSVDHYVVNISNTNLKYFVDTTTTNTSSFADLYPGRVFDIKVTAVAGNFENMSDLSSFATVPTPPGPITISHKTNSSLHLNWTTPAMMEGAPDISYHITYQPEGGDIQSKNSSGYDTELSLLLSGTSYRITVKTVGPQGLNSTAVHTSDFTLPNPVLNIEARPDSTTSIKVQWSEPLGVQPYYQYWVQTYNATGALADSKNVTSHSTDVPHLEPGSEYSIDVTTIAGPDSKSTAEQTFSYTMPKAVTNLTAEIVTTTAIQLMWLRQSDHKPSYSYRVTALQDGTLVHNDSTKIETYTFYRLIPGEEYTFHVFTVVEEVKSAVESTSSHTRPEAVPHITAIGSTTDLTVSWLDASGQVSSYSVRLYRDGNLVEGYTDLNNVTLTKQFMSLTPGVLYCVEVVTKSGRFENNASVCNATFPNPPGPIRVESQTVQSIKFTWPLPEDMDHHLYSFNVSTANGSMLIENSWFLLDKLQSGSSYSVSVVTVGRRDYKSTVVTAENYTRPYPVTNLRPTEITTDAVTLVWEQPERKPDYSYMVEVTSGSSTFPGVVSENTTATVVRLRSGSNFSVTVTTRAADGTAAEPLTESYFTRPDVIRGLQAETLNSTAILLNWTQPLEYRNAYRYLVKTTHCASQSETLAGERTLISELTPGTSCAFCVSVIAADGIKGEQICASQYTKPETGQLRISSQDNSSVLVSWTKPRGNVELYEVCLIGNSSDFNQRKWLNSTSTSVLFKDLSAGRLYRAMLTTSSGPFSASSGFITNATFPNPPGPIEILMKTTGSIEFGWREAPLMAGASFVYQLTNTPSQEGKNITTDTTIITNHTFHSLLSGTSYNISVATVGPRDFESGRVHRDMVTTRPRSVRSLMARADETRITVIWSRPEEYKGSYRYNLTWQRSDEALSNSIVLNGTEYDIDELDPGSRYNFSATTETSDGTQGAPEWISNCTDASPVRDLQCEGPNKTNAEVILRWTQPKGRSSGFLVSLDDRKVNSNITCCNHTVSSLLHYTEYTLTVETQSCGQPSTPVSLKCWTGITNPPVPDDYEKLVAVTTKEYNRFSIQIDADLLNKTKGPITHVGVLVRSKVPDNTADLSQYLGNTWDEWKAGDTPGYLATVAAINAQSRSNQSHLDISVGDESKWNGYTNGALNANGKYQYAIALFTSLELQEDLVVPGLSLVTVTGFSSLVELPPDPAVIGIAIGATLGIFFILFIVLIGFIIYWKRLSNKEQTDIQIHSMRAKVSVAVRVEEYEAYYKKQKADSNCGFAEEFEDLKLVGTGQSKVHALNLENKPKNRYNNVLPYDSSRVKLSIIHGNPYDDYINANYMPGYLSRKEFVAAQGPLPTTVSEFWRMIWEKNVQTLVMLTRCNEQGRVKCEQYWAPGTKHFDDMTVTTTSEIPLEDWTIRDFDIKNVKTAETRSVRHFHFTAWPDHGVPETTELLISFRHLVREHMNQYSRHSPTVVHCSAGVGRTGTFIAIDRLIFQIERENIVDVYGIVHDLRMHRPLMVQTEDQYVFLNQCALDIIRSRTGTNVDLIYQNAAALSIYENVEPKRGFSNNRHNDP